MKKIFIVIFAAMFIGVFALNINYQLKPVDNIWGLNNAEADVSSGVTGLITGGLILPIVVIKAISNIVSAVISSNDKPLVFHWNKEDKPCTVEVFRKQNAAANVAWEVASKIVGGGIDFSYESKKVAGTEWQSVYVEKDGKYYREKEAISDCVPNS